jgi:hypothetical protein
MLGVRNRNLNLFHFKVEIEIELDFSNFILNPKATIEINLSLPFVKAQYEV